MENYYSVRQIAKFLSVNQITVRRWIQKKKLPAIHLDKEYRIAKSDLEKYIADRRIDK